MGKQKNVPIDEEYHAELGRIAILDRTSMKGTVQTWIRKDGRGKLVPPPKPTPAGEPTHD
jgi:hypothetical protein